MPPAAPPHPRRSRRVEDALSQLIDSLVSRASVADDDDEGADDENAADQQRHRRALERAWRTIDGHSATAVGPSGDAGPDSSPAPPPASSMADVVNNAPDMIKRKLLREHASPDRAVRFSNLYSRLLTQPVLGQKWAILYLLLRISGEEEEEEAGGDGKDAGVQGEEAPPPRDNVGRARSSALVDDAGEAGVSSKGGAQTDDGRRSPLLEEHQLDNMLGNRDKSRSKGDAADNIPPVSSSSAAQPTARGRENSPTLEQNRSGSQRAGHYAKGTRAGGGSALGRSKEEPESTSKPQHDQVQPQDMPTGEPPSESALLRDLPFCLQGLSTTNLDFSGSDSLRIPRNLPVPLVSLLHTMAEPCLLYRRISAFVGESEGGLIEQSLRAAIGDELRSYLGLVATLEGEIRRALTAVSSEGSTDTNGVMRSGVTLKRCVVWTRDATMALRLMSLMIEESQNKKGGQLISTIHGFSTTHGDPFVGTFAEKLLVRITRPFYGMLRHWIYDGELSDPYHEFFVVQPEVRHDVDPRRTATSVWDEKYKLDDAMVPTIMTHELAKKVFLIGKSLNFIRYGCADSAWVEGYSRGASKELRYGDTATLETSIDEAYKTTMARLTYLMDSKFKLFDHLNALKKYLLLGQGDFIAQLMESLASNLDRPANSQYRHTLTAQLEHAIRASNAQYDSPDVLRRLDARMLELSHGEIGWDCFTLEYKIDAPVDVIITPWAATQYLKVFNFLWRVKRVEFALVSTWRRCTTGARDVLGSVDDKVGADWKRARCAMAEMMHFVSQLQYYILFEVIEASWDQLQVAIGKPECTLDDLIEAHTKYLNSITHKGLLGSSSSKGGGASKDDSFLSQLHQILKTMLAYKDAMDGLYSFSVAEFTRRQEFSAKIETRTAQGRWGITEKDLQQQSNRSSRRPTAGQGTPYSAADSSNPLDPSSSSGPAAAGLADEDHLLPSLRSRLRDLSADFRSRLVTLLGDLAYQPDVDMRFLGVVMNFNDVYQVTRRKRGVATTGREKKRAHHHHNNSTGTAGAAAGDKGET